jgi:hypothetical protein
VAEVAAARAMKHRAGPELGSVYETGLAGRLSRLSTWLTAGGAATALLGRRSRRFGVLGGLCVAAGSACERFAVFEAGKASAGDPRYVVEPQRRRLAERAHGRAGAKADTPAGTSLLSEGSPPKA